MEPSLDSLGIVFIKIMVLKEYIDLMYWSDALFYFIFIFREKMVAGWLEKCIELDIPCSENYSLQKILGDPVEV